MYMYKRETLLIDLSTHSSSRVEIRHTYSCYVVRAKRKGFLKILSLKWSNKGLKLVRNTWLYGENTVNNNSDDGRVS